MPKTNTMVEMTNEMVSAGLSAQSIGLKLLLAEMRALSEVLPGSLGQMAALPAQVGAAQEADFDNMPV